MVSNTYFYQSILLLLGSFEFSSETEEKEKNFFESVKGLMRELPATDS